MWQEVIITDLTRMSGNKVCIAGISLNNKSIRPDLPFPGITEQRLYKGGAVIIRPGNVVRMNLEPKKDCEPPHTEDHEWLESEKTTWLRTLNATNWKSVLQRISYPGVNDIFVGRLQENKYHPPNMGIRSLGTIKVQSIDAFAYTLNQWGKLNYRLSFTDSTGQNFRNISITDLALRCYADHLHEVPKLTFDQISEKIYKLLCVDENWLRLGLARPFKASDQSEILCYLQVNGIYSFPDYLNGKNFADFK